MINREWIRKQKDIFRVCVCVCEKDGERKAKRNKNNHCFERGKSKKDKIGKRGREICEV